MEGLIFGILRYLIIISSVYMYNPIPGFIFGGHFHTKYETVLHQCCVRQAQKRENLEMNGTGKDFIQSVIQEGRKKKPKHSQQESNV